MPLERGASRTRWKRTVFPSRERATSTKVSYGIPDVIGSRREEFIGKRTLVIGSGDSAINVTIAVMDVQTAIRRPKSFGRSGIEGVDRLLGGGLNDKLPERGALVWQQRGDRRWSFEHADVVFCRRDCVRWKPRRTVFGAD